jgi:hypothetical protein
VLATGANGRALLDELVVGAAGPCDGAGNSSDSVRDRFSSSFRQWIETLGAVTFLGMFANICAIGGAETWSVVRADSLAKRTGVADGQVLLEHKNNDESGMMNERMTDRNVCPTLFHS